MGEPVSRRRKAQQDRVTIPELSLEGKLRRVRTAPRVTVVNPRVVSRCNSAGKTIVEQVGKRV
jgi:hypothetical protein